MNPSKIVLTGVALASSLALAGPAAAQPNANSNIDRAGVVTPTSGNVTTNGFAWPLDLAPFQFGILPSNPLGETEVCVRNLSKDKRARVNITIRVGKRYINAGQTACYRNWFWGTPIIVNNISSSTGAWVRTFTK